LQGFPDRFRFLGDRTSQYEQVGNAVPVPLARAVAEEVARCLRGAPGPRLQDPFRRRPVAAIGRHGELRVDDQLWIEGAGFDPVSCVNSAGGFVLDGLA
jgi:hypothetical protein